MKLLPFLLLGIALVCLAPDAGCAETPSAEEIVARVHPEHPRILARADDFAKLLESGKSSPRVGKWTTAVRATADDLLKAAPSKYEIPDGKRLLATSRRVLDRTLALGLTFRLTNDERYAERIWQEIEAAANFPDWNPRHFLDTAEMTAAFAVAYDWLYQYWTPERRATIRAAIVEKGLKPSLPIYRRDKGWAAAEHNWNQVCNGGMTMGALAIAEEEPALAGEILAAAIRTVPRAMKHFAPDGAWGEGPGYWDYATKYNVFMIAALQSATGADCGLSDIEGFSHAADFPIHITGPIGRTFNYADAGDRGTGDSQMLWFAERFQNPSYAAWRIARVDNSPTPLDLLWGARWLDRDPKIAGLPVAKYFRGAEVVTMRSSWNDPLATFVGFKGGDNRVNHGHLDLGSFVLDAGGQRWALDLGSDDYNLPGYFGRERWNYYRCRAEGQNALVINPGAEPDQDPNAKAPVTKFHTQGGNSSAVVDLTQAYANAASSVQRGISLDEGRVVMRDEIKAANPVDVWWFMHTDAEITTEGGRATLSKGGKKLSVRILEPSKAVFEVRAAEPLPSSPQPARQQVKGIWSHDEPKRARKLAINLSGVTNGALMIEFIVEGDQEAAIPRLSLAEWPSH